jgi:hypothetical protein
VETDIISSVETDGRKLTITQWQDDSKIVIDLSSGRELQGDGAD